MDIEESVAATKTAEMNVRLDGSDPSSNSASTADVDSGTEAPMAAAKCSKVERIRELNDKFRRTFNGSNVVLTRGFSGLPSTAQQRAIEAIKAFDSFTSEYDTYREHDLVNVEIDGRIIFGKIDYYDLDMGFPSDDPADPTVTTRVMTIMLSEEF